MIEKATLVVGVGEVGGPLAQVLESSGPVLRHDIKPIEFDEPIGIMHVCFPFRNQDSFCRTATQYIQRFSPELTIINSTVIPGTTRRLELMTGRSVCYSPVRGKHVEMANALRRYRKFIAGSNQNAVERAERHFRAAGLETERMSSPDALELAKLSETTYFGVLIAFAQELNRYANGADVDYAEITNFFKEISFLPNTTYFPGFIGGHCVIPNIKLLLQVASSPLLEAVMASNDLRARELESRPIAQAHDIQSTVK